MCRSTTVSTLTHSSRMLRCGVWKKHFVIVCCFVVQLILSQHVDLSVMYLINPLLMVWHPNKSQAGVLVWMRLRRGNAALFAVCVKFNECGIIKEILFERCFSIVLVILGNRVPVDGKTFLKEYVVVEETSRIVVFSLTSIGICLGLFFFVINIRFRNKRYLSNVVSVQFISVD